MLKGTSLVMIVGYNSAIIRNAFSIGFQWCSVFLTREKRAAVHVTENASVALQLNKYIGSCGPN